MLSSIRLSEKERAALAAMHEGFELQLAWGRNSFAATLYKKDEPTRYVGRHTVARLRNAVLIRYSSDAKVRSVALTAQGKRVACLIAEEMENAGK